MRSESHTDHHPHLTDDGLLDAYFTGDGGAHLHACGECRDRYESLARALDQIHDDSVREADEIFNVDRLHEQRERILRRLERHGHPADVLRFPNRLGSRPASHRLLGPARRWIAGAAAAGLVAGLFLGFAVDRRVTAPLMQTRAALATTIATTISSQGASAQDEEMLTEIEDALNGPNRRVNELRALDLMTIPPDLQEVSFVPR
jgi:hypothetical protein